MTVKVSKPAINVREELADLRKPTGVAGEAMLRAETPQEQFNLIGAGRRNILINGDFQVSQRGDFTTASSATSNYYWVDRWLPSLGTVTANWQHKTDQLVNGIITNTARLEATSSATGYFQLYQKIEGYKICLGREVTISAWVKSNYPVNLYCYDGASQIGYSENHPADGQWHKLTSTFVLNSSSGALSAYVSTYDKASSAITTGDYFEAALVQLELGKVATPFEHRSYGEELALAQRFYTRLGNDDGGFTHLMVGAAEGATTYVVSRSLSTMMRAVPTLTVGSGVNAFTASAGAVSVIGFSTRCTRDIACISTNVSGTATIGQAAVLYDAGANGYIELDAEL